MRSFREFVLAVLSVSVGYVAALWLATVEAQPPDPSSVPRVEWSKADIAEMKMRLDNAEERLAALEGNPAVIEGSRHGEVIGVEAPQK